MEHLNPHLLEQYALDPSTVAARPAVEAHLDACATCRATVEESRQFIALLEDPDTWEVAASETSAAAPDELRRFAIRCAIEDRDAEALLAGYRTAPPSQLPWDDLPSRREYRTGGVVRLLCRWANQMCEPNPLFALTLADTAIAISALLQPSLFPRNSVHELRGTAWKEQGNALRFLGRLPEALKALDRAETEYRQLPLEGIGLVAVDYIRAYVLFDQDAFEEAEKLANRAAIGARNLGDTERAMRAHHLRGEIVFERGAYRSAADHFAAVLAYGEAQNDQKWIARESLGLGNCAIELGELEAARRFLQRALTAFTALQFGPDMTRTRWARARLAWREGLPSDAVRQLHVCIDEFTRHGTLTDAALVAVDLAEILDATSRSREIPRVLSGVVRTFISAGKLTGALTALGYLSSAASTGMVDPAILTKVRRFVKRADRLPHLQFAPPL
jgi:tetratricopeptide (TPR) repeat protein